MTRTKGPSWLRFGGEGRSRVADRIGIVAFFSLATLFALVVLFAIVAGVLLVVFHGM